MTEIVPREAGKVLIVDDDFALREACVALEGEGFDLASAANGREALDYLHNQRRPCLVLLDLMMPIMNGWEFRGEQRSAPELADIPVVALSAFARLGDEELRGVERFLRKPIDLADLLTTVRTYCG